MSIIYTGYKLQTSYDNNGCRHINNDLRPFAWTNHPIDIKQMVFAYYEEFKFQLERVKLLHTIVAPIDVLDTQMARLPLTAVAATLMTLWVIISSSQDSEFLGFYDDSFETVHTWVCLKIVHPYTQWLMIIIPTKWLQLGVYPIFRHTHLVAWQLCATKTAPMIPMSSMRPPISVHSLPRSLGQ